MVTAVALLLLLSVNVLSNSISADFSFYYCVYCFKSVIKNCSK